MIEMVEFKKIMIEMVESTRGVHAVKIWLCAIILGRHDWDLCYTCCNRI